jgi:hypothetical protein
MMSKRKFFEAHNSLKKNGTSYGIIVIKACIFIITLFAFTSIALALNWKDKKVGNTACPENPIGEWKSVILNFHNEKTIDIQDNKIVIVGNNNSEEYFLRNKNTFKIGGKSIEFTINTVDRKKEVYLKVKPHLITTKFDHVNSNHKYHNC